MTTRSRIVLVVHRVLLRMARPPLARLWALLYRLIARGWAAYLVRGEREPSTYVRGSIGAHDVLPGLSDVDVAVVLADAGGRARARATERWMGLRRHFRLTDLLLDYPLIYEEADLRAAAGTSALSFARGAAYSGPRASQDTQRLLERPGLYDSTGDWRLLSGPDRRPPEAIRDAQARRIAAWLELVAWWQWVGPACADPAGPRTAALCMKLVAEPARIWLWLAHGERASGRREVLRRALERLPEEEPALRGALALHDRLPTSPRPPLAEVLPALVRLSERIAALIAAQVEDAGTTEVALAGGPEEDLTLRGGGWLATLDKPRLHPLCDWRALVTPGYPDESFGLVPGDPADPELLGALTAAQGYGPQPAVRSRDLVVFPAQRSRTRLRAVQCRATDPVSFALADGRGSATFPNVRGWSVADTARRAVAEHAPRLAGAAGGDGLGLLLSAARAALFHDSPDELPLTLAETARRLSAPAADDALGHYRESASTEPPPAVVEALRELVRGLPAYEPRGVVVH